METEQLNLIRIKELCELTTLKRSTVFKAIRNSLMPKPIKLLGKINCWDKAEIIKWLESMRSVNK